MTDFITLDPARFTVDELLAAARGELRTLKPQLAVTLLQAKLGDRAGEQLAELASSTGIDQRARHAATLALASYPAQRDVLLRLRSSPEPLIVEAATEALRSR